MQGWVGVVRCQIRRKLGKCQRLPEITRHLIGGRRIPPSCDAVSEQGAVLRDLEAQLNGCFGLLAPDQIEGSADACVIAGLDLVRGGCQFGYRRFGQAVC